MSGKIEPRFGVEVYVGENLHVCVKQDQCGEEQLLLLHREEAAELIRLLQDAIEESASMDV